MKHDSGNKADLDGDAVVVVPRAPFLKDKVTDDRLVLHSSMMTLAAESEDLKELNVGLKRWLWQPSWGY